MGGFNLAVTNRNNQLFVGSIEVGFHKKISAMEQQIADSENSLFSEKTEDLF